MKITYIYGYRRLALLAATCLLTSFAAGCEIDLDDDCEEGSGVSETFEIETDPFTELRLSGNADIILSQADIPSLSITIDDNLIEHIIYTYRKDELHIRNERCISTQRPMRVELAVPDLEKITISGSSSITSLGTLEFASLQVEVSGSAEIDMALRSSRLSSTILGNAEVNLNGSATEHDIVVSGNASVSAAQFETKTTDIDISGNANCRIWAEDELNVKISGSGNVAYRGDPQIDSNISGSGSLTQIP